MKNWAILLTLWLIFPLSILVAQDAKENYLKAQELYGSGQFLEAERLLVEAERQLGGPKAATTSLIILCQYKSNSFFSYDLLKRVAVLKSMNPETTDVYKEILQIENTVITWKKDLDVKITTIVSSKDLNAAKVESEKNYKIKDYNITFDKLYEEISILTANLTGSSSYKEWYSTLANMKRIETGSQFGYQTDATERIASLEIVLFAKIVFDKYPDEAERLYNELLRNGRYYGEVIQKTQERRTTEARIAEEKRLADLRRTEETKRELLNEAERLEQAATGHKILGGVMIAGGVAGIGLAVFSVMDLLNREDSSQSSTLHVLGGGLGFGIGYWLLSTNREQFESARYYSERAEDSRREAQRYSTTILPIFGVNKGHMNAGLSLYWSY